MNLTLQTSEFTKELELLVKIVATKPTIPALANVLVQADGTGVRLATTDLEIGLVTFCLATVHSPGTTTLPAKHLLEVNRLLTGELSITMDKASACLENGKYHSRLQTYPATDYPTMPSMKDLQTVEIQGFQDAVRRVRFAVTDKDKRYFLNGALLSFTPSGFILAATDSHRLALVKSESQTWEHEPIIIPSKALDKITETTGDILLACSAKHIFFVVDGRMLFSRMIDGKFPDYARIIPKDTDRTAVVSRLEFLSALQRVVLTADVVVLTFASNVLTITTRNATIGDAAEKLDVQYQDADSILTLNGVYILEFLNAAVSSSITIQWKDTGTVLFVDNDSYTYVQMPLRSI